MSEVAAEEYRQLVEERCQALLEAVQSVTLGNLDVSVEVPEGIGVFADLAAGIDAMVGDLRKMAAEQERARAELDESRQYLEVALQDMQRAQQRYVREAWSGYGLSGEASQGYEISEERRGATDRAWVPGMAEAVQSKKPVTGYDDSGSATLALPIVFANEVIGVLGFRRLANGGWSDDEVADADAVAMQLGQALENQRLLDEELRSRIALNEQVKALDCLNNIGRQTQDAPSVPDFLEYVAGRIPAAMRYSDACRVAITLGDKVYGAPDALTLPRHMVQGLRIAGEIVGRIYIGYVQDHEFLDEESAMLGDIARRVAGHIESRRLLDETRANAAEFAVLYELGRSLSAQLSMSQVLDQVHQGVADLMDATNFYIGLYDRDQAQVSFPLNVTESEVDEHITVIDAGEGLTGYVLQTGESLLIEEDVARWMDDHGIPTVGEPAQCWLGVPLIVGGEVQGVIAVQDYKAPRAFDASDRNRLSAIASQAAVAIQNAQLFEEIQTRVRHEQVLREISARVRSTSDPDLILRAAVQELGMALGRRTFARLGTREDLGAPGATAHLEGGR